MKKFEFYLPSDEEFMKDWELIESKGLIKYILSWWTGMIIVLLASLGTGYYNYYLSNNPFAKFLTSQYTAQHYIINTVKEAFIYLFLVIFFSGFLQMLKYRKLKRKASSK